MSLFSYRLVHNLIHGRMGEVVIHMISSYGNLILKNVTIYIRMLVIVQMIYIIMFLTLNFVERGVFLWMNNFYVDKSCTPKNMCSV